LPNIKLIEKDNLENNYRTETDYLPINRWPELERPREKLIKKGPEYLSDCELLAIILRTGMGSSKERFSALDLAKKILADSGSLKNLLELSFSEFLKINGIGRAKAAQVMAALELGRRAVSEKNGNNVSFKCSEEVANYYIPLLKDLKKEQFRVLLLDIKNRVIKEVLVSQGSLTSSMVRLATMFLARRVKAIALPV
jgi:DNA repair protein RadC